MCLDEDISIDERGQRSGVMHSDLRHTCMIIIGLLSNMWIVAMSHTDL